MTRHSNPAHDGEGTCRHRSAMSRNARLSTLNDSTVAFAVAICLATFFSAGCQTLSLSSPSELFEDEPDFVTPNKIIPVWSDTVLHQAGKPGRRGCGGRVMFYAGDGKKAVQVDGSLIVYVWDDSSDDKQQKPNRKYVFPAEDVQKHYSSSTIGDSYSFWIPWDETGGEQTELTLVARFIGRNGAEVTSAPGKVILPGEVPEVAGKETQRRSQRSETWHTELKGSEIQQVGFEQTSTVTKNPTRESMTTASIPLTDGFLERNLHRPDAYSSDELFKLEPDHRDTVEQDQRRAVDQPENHANEKHFDSQNVTDSIKDVNSAPPDGSLRFRHRVRTSREAQRSVDHALSERYRSESRRAPWERD